MTQETPPSRPELATQPGETQEEALRCEFLILIDHGKECGMSEDEIDDVLHGVVDARAVERRKSIKIVGSD